MIKLFALILLALPSLSFADGQQQAYKMTVARVLVDYACEMSNDNGGTVDCTTRVAGAAELPIVMNAEPDGSFKGSDMVMGSGGDYLTVINATADRKVKSVDSMRMQMGEDGLSMQISAFSTAASSLESVMLSPWKIQLTEKGNMSLSFTVIAYGAAAEAQLVNVKNHKALNAYVMKQIQPAIKAFQNKLN